MKEHYYCNIFELNVFCFKINVKQSNIIINRMNNRLLHQTTHSPGFKESIRDSIYRPSSSNKVMPAFITQKPLVTHQNQIKEIHNQLNSYIDDLDGKIQKIIQFNQAELLFAYKNHLERVRAEMTDFKEEAMTVLEAEASHKQKINLMEKQLIIFREEALNIFEKSLKKDKIIELLRLQLEECQSQNAHMKETVKSLLKRNKELEAAHKMVDLQDKKREKIINEDYLGRIQVNSFTSLGMSSNKKFFNHHKKSSKERVMTSSVNNSKMLTQSNFRTTEPNHFKELQQSNPINYLDNFTRKLKIKLAYIQPTLLENIIDSANEVYNTVDSRVRNPFKRYPNDIEIIRKTDNSIRSKSYHTCESNSKIKKSFSGHSKNKSITSLNNQMGSDNELKDCFKMSVQAIKKQIVRRKKMKTINFFKEGSPVSLQDFKKIDFINLIQLVFSNEKIIHLIYNSIFNMEH